MNYLTLEQRVLLRDFVNLYLKIIKNKDLDKYDLELISILEEYDYLVYKE